MTHINVKSTTMKPAFNSISRRHILVAPFALAGLGKATAQTGVFSRPITIINPFPPGTITDTVSRILGQPMSQMLGTPVVVDSKPGASGAIAAQYVMRAVPDGRTLLIGSSTVFTINPHLVKKPPYKPFEDFVPVATILSVPTVLVARPDFPADNLRDFIRLARQSPGKFSYASFGNGTSAHLIMEHLKHEAGLDVLHVPYKNGSTAATALIGGEVNVGFDSLFSAIPRAKSGQVKILGVMQAQRASAVPEIMSTTDAGYPQVGYMAWLALFAPAATPVATLDAIAAAVRRAASQPDIQGRFAELGTEPMSLDRPTFLQHLRKESAQMESIIRLAKIEQG
jgi:tripartite-type tricarboxylate transporter receptor subunit TctC